MKGDKAVEQYFPPVRDMFDNLETCPDKFLLWFHRCGWDYKLKSGRTLWNALCEKYDEGASQAAALQNTWQSLSSRIDPQRHKEVSDRLVVQVPTPRRGEITSCSTSRVSVAGHWFGARR